MSRKTYCAPITKIDSYMRLKKKTDFVFKITEYTLQYFLSLETVVYGIRTNHCALRY